MLDNFGETDPRLMPSHLFWSAIRLDYTTAVRADINRQNYSVCPRHWYIDAIFKCARCEEELCFTVSEQKQWYEHQRFWIDSIAKQCKECRRLIRRERSLRREYDRDVSDALNSDDLLQKQRLVDVIDEFRSIADLVPQKMLEHRDALVHQIGKTLPAQSPEL